MSGPRHSADSPEELRAFLASLGFGWRGFRRKRKLIGPRLRRRLGELGIGDLSAYRDRVARDPDERRRLHILLGVTVTRFFRDRVDWELLEARVLTPWLREHRKWRAWSMGCAGGEEPYTLAMIWSDLAARTGDGEARGAAAAHRQPAVRAADDARDPALEILATDADPALLQRARRAIYPRAALRAIPERFHRQLEIRADAVVVGPALRRAVDWRCHDYLEDPWPGAFDLILARNGLFTYRDAGLYDAYLDRLASSLRPEGVLFVGSNDRMPPTAEDRFTRIGRTIWHLRSAHGSEVQSGEPRAARRD